MFSQSEPFSGKDARTYRVENDVLTKEEVLATVRPLTQLLLIFVRMFLSARKLLVSCSLQLLPRHENKIS